MSNAAPSLRTTTLLLGGMRSVHCARAVYTALAGVEGIRTADVVVGRAVIEHDARVTPAAMEAAIAQVGYTVVEVMAEPGRRLPLL